MKEKKLTICLNEKYQKKKMQVQKQPARIRKFNKSKILKSKPTNDIKYTYQHGLLNT